MQDSNYNSKLRPTTGIRFTKNLKHDALSNKVSLYGSHRREQESIFLKPTRIATAMKRPKAHLEAL